MTGTEDRITGKIPEPLRREVILSRLEQCPSLPSLDKNAREIVQLLNAGQAYTQEICEIVQRDPSLTARVLRMVNSVYFGLAEPVRTIEEAVFFVGTEQIRHLAMATPIIDDFQTLVGRTPFSWRPFWQHCIAVALLTREIISSLVAQSEESDYVAGLVHDVGKIVMAAAFPQHFRQVHARLAGEPAHLIEVEEQVLGMNHMELGALYLQKRNLPPALVEAAWFHHAPEKAQKEPTIAAAVQLANLIAKKHLLGNSGDSRPVSLERCLAASGWDILAPGMSPEGRATAYSGWLKSIQEMPSVLESVV